MTKTLEAIREKIMYLISFKNYMTKAKNISKLSKKITNWGKYLHLTQNRRL